MKNNNGFSFIEILVALSILGAFIFYFTGGNSDLLKRNKNLEELMIMERHVNSLYENIQSNIDIYQITYNPKDFNNNADPTKIKKYLPIAWDMNNLTTVSDCSECPGRMGFVIVPLEGYRGLYKLTIRVTHPNISVFKDYLFLINGK